jgi:hypothetical protein
MPRFYLHLWNGSEHVLDQEGDELESAEAAYLEAFEAAKEMAADLIRSRIDATAYRFDVVDAHGRAVLDLPFAEVLGTKSMPPRPASKAVMPAHEAVVPAVTKRRQELMWDVAQQIMIARSVMSSARATLARAQR